MAFFYVMRLKRFGINRRNEKIEHFLRKLRGGTIITVELSVGFVTPKGDCYGDSYLCEERGMWGCEVI